MDRASAILGPDAIALSARGSFVSKERAAAEELVRVHRGVYLRARSVGSNSPPWVVRRKVAAARLLAISHYVRPGDLLFTGESALTAWGIDTWWNNPDLECRRRGSGFHSPALAPVIVHDVRVPGVNVRRMTSKAPGEAFPFQGAGALSVGTLSPVRETLPVPTARPEVVALDILRAHHPLQALHNASMLLRALSGFDRRMLKPSRDREQLLVEDWRAQLSALGRSHRIRAARSVLEMVNAGIESPAESIALWTLRHVLPRAVPVISQFPVAHRGGTYFLDLALPEQRVAFEVSGYGKFGNTEASAWETGRKLLSRQQDLQDLGWDIINLTYDRVRRLPHLSAYLAKALTERGVAVQPTPVSAPPSLMSPSRRF